MTAQRRDADRDAAASTARVWQMYADEIGIPDALSATAAGNELPPSPRRAPRRRKPLLRIPAGYAAVAGIAAVVIAVTTGTILWYEGLAPLRSEDPPSTSGASGPGAAPVTTTAPAGLPSKAATDRPEAAAPAAVAQTDATALRGKPATESVLAPPADRVPPVSASEKAETGPVRRLQPAEARRTHATFLRRINFDFASDRITDAARPALDEVVDQLKRNPDWRIAIEGHTDAYGAPEYNRALSQRRAEAVKAHLEAAGIAPSRLSVVAFGASRPVAPNDSPLHVLNRRVDFHRR